MKARTQYSKASKSYDCSNALTDLMKDLLRFENMARTGRNADDDSVTTKELKRERVKLNRRKVEILNKHIFPNMANLTVFLEAMTNNDFIRYIFREDLQALFFAKSTTNKNMKNKYVFRRFINAICSFEANIVDHETRKPSERFKLILCDIMQESINEQMKTIAPFIFNDIVFPQETLGPDMIRARAWTRMLAREAYEDLKFNKERRPALF
jgi:hypothetical protein